MQSGTLLHLAILRKLARNNPTVNYRERYNSIKRKQLYANLTEENVLDNSPQPLVEVCHNRELVRVKETGGQKMRKIENMTISGWSTKSIQISHQKEDQNAHVNLNKKQMSQKTKKTSFVRRRHLSQANNIKVKVPVPLLNQNFIPDYEFKRKYKSPIVFKPQYYPLKQTNLNYRPDISTQEKNIAQPSAFLTQKLPSFDAFITEMKQRAKNKKNKL